MFDIGPDIQALIFDCDGTLADSMPIHMKAWEKAFLDFNAPYREDFLDPLKGMHEEEIVGLFNKEFGFSLNPETLVDRKHRYYLEQIADVKPIQPVVDVVHRFTGILPNL
jgi:beta-phosphoglucomutase-like phosphatase (HAD superfamily)